MKIEIASLLDESIITTVESIKEGQLISENNKYAYYNDDLVASLLEEKLADVGNNDPCEINLWFTYYYRSPKDLYSIFEKMNQILNNSNKTINNFKMMDCIIDDIQCIDSNILKEFFSKVNNITIEDGIICEELLNIIQRECTGTINIDTKDIYGNNIRSTRSESTASQQRLGRALGHLMPEFSQEAQEETAALFKETQKTQGPIPGSGLTSDPGLPEETLGLFKLRSCL